MYRVHTKVLRPGFCAAPAYMMLLPPATPPPSDVYEFLDCLSIRLGMLKKGGERDHRRAAVWFIKWWREEGCLASARSVPSLPLPTTTPGSWGLELQPGHEETPVDASLTHPERTGWGFDFEWGGLVSDMSTIQAKLEERIDAHAQELEEDKNSGDGLSLTQEKKQAREEKIARRRARAKVRT